jgi:hypothetical protein
MRGRLLDPPGARERQLSVPLDPRAAGGQRPVGRLGQILVALDEEAVAEAVGDVGEADHSLIVHDVAPQDWTMRWT